MIYLNTQFILMTGWRTSRSRVQWSMMLVAIMFVRPKDRGVV